MRLIIYPIGWACIAVLALAFMALRLFDSEEA